MADSKSEILQGTLDLMVLKTLDAMGPMHGYGIARRIEQLSEDALQINQGTIYLCLIRLVQKGWIKAEWGTSENNRKAKFYAISKAGRKQLAAETENWERVSGVIGRLLLLDRGGDDDADRAAAAGGAAARVRRDATTSIATSTQELDSHLADADGRQHPPRHDARGGAPGGAGFASGRRLAHRAASRRPRPARVVGSILQDLRFAFALIAKDRWFSAAAIAALALGIGANAVGFTIVNAAFLRGLPFEDADRLLHPVVAEPIRPPFQRLVLPTCRTGARPAAAFAGACGVSRGAVNISDDRALPEQVQRHVGHGERVRRPRAAAAPRPRLRARRRAAGADPVVIIGYDVWKSRYRGDPNVLGESLRVNGQPATIIGVMPEGMKFPDRHRSLGAVHPDRRDQQRSARPLRVFGRLTDGVDRRPARRRS